MVAPSVRVPDTLGQTLHQLALANGLAKSGIDVTLLCRYDKEASSNIKFHPNLKFVSVVNPGIPFERLIFTKHAYQKVISQLKSESFDIVHDRGYIFAGSGVQPASELGVKSILQIDDNWMRSELSATKIARLWPYNQGAEYSCRYQIERATGGFTVSTVLREQISTWSPEAKNFSVIQNGYEEDLFRPDVKSFRIREKSTIFIFIMAKYIFINIFIYMFWKFWSRHRFINDFKIFIQFLISICLYHI